MEANIYIGDTEFDFQIYEKLWIIQRKGVVIYLKYYLIDFLSAILVASIIKCNDQHSRWFSEDPIIDTYH